jgi:ATP-dependent helicase HrpB
MNAAPLPVRAILPALEAALHGAGVAVVVAPPGSGKTTVIPPWLVDAGVVPRGEVVVLQPRRVAARAVATYLAAERGEPVGETIGYQVRFEKKVSARTRVRFVTEGVLTAWLQRDPSLEGVGAVVLDEFHERSVHADLGLAFLREVRGALRDDLRLIVMSATLAAEPVSQWLGGAPILTAEGRAYPIEIAFAPPPPPRPGPRRAALVLHASAVIAEAVRAPDAGDILCFMPGAREIDDTVSALAAMPALRDHVVLPLHGRLPPAAQDRAVLPDPDGRPRVVVATNVAETSLTIPGVRTVVDSGLARVSRYDPAVGSTRLELERISRASAAQRAGRAGRLGPGRAIRLWAAHEDERLRPFDDPEIQRVDPSAVVLALLEWGVRDPAAFEFFEAPRGRALPEAMAWLDALGATKDGVLAPLGRALARVPLEPRLAATLVFGRRIADLPRLAALLAGLADGSLSGDVTDAGRHELPGRARDAAAQLVNAVRALDAELPGLPVAPTFAAAVVAGHVDRVAVRRGDGLWQLSGGRRVALDGQGELAVALAVDGGQRGEGAMSRARAFYLVSRADLDATGRVRVLRTVTWDAQRERVNGVLRTDLAGLALDERPEPLSDRVAAQELLAAQAARSLPRLVAAVPDRHRARLARLRHLGRLYHDLGLPEETDAWLEAALPALAEGLSSLGALLAALDERLGPALDALIPREAKARLAAELPEALPIPSGRVVRLEWPDEGAPVLAAKVQELFGWSRGPVLAGGRLPCVVHLLDPGGKPLQVTRDLENFWRETWRSVRAEMRSRYPKHHWPEDPLGEVASTRTTARAYRSAEERKGGGRGGR